ncbi:VPLPA-CTERM sorting domain-containing protein [Psychromonas sp. B3M02]|uniref:PEP-CTERM sorting domain-containing protein n=1 Tax=Psychromonas sp. B3M02 TaxID=2267226 RepID=UPI000DEAAA9A|nr:PEP-CTERM sorting domain-containing protein [Psychromonas sp. B3M02]RBW46614.1 VPLPA-CTERM sorting domain-containing protein [Psychromonas sp. B3M02]
MKKRLGLTTLLFAMNANAALINFESTSASNSGALINYDNVVTPTSIVGDAIFTLNVNGDFNSNYEYADLVLNGFSLGRILDSNTSNDLFNFTNDVGNQSISTITGTATISESVFSSLISDGFLDFSFDASSSVNCCGTINELSGTISFTESTSIPEPAPLMLLGLGLLGFAKLRKKK